MKKILAFILFVAGVAVPAGASDEAGPRLFPVRLEAHMARYGGTLPPLLPDMADKRAAIERPESSVPGRMLMMRSITVDKTRRRVYLCNALGDTLMNFPVCASQHFGQKRTADDCRTPEGTFKIFGVYNSTDWTYKDTNSKCYGPFFIHLDTRPFYGIGIHGTNTPGSIPGRSSHGCMRLHNEDVTRLRPLVHKELRVTVTPDPV